MAVAWPAVKARLVTLLSGLDGYALATDPAQLATDALVYDGPIVSTENPARFVTVGWQDSTDDQTAGSYEQSSLSDGFAADETGTVLLEFAAVTGDPEVPDAFAMVDALQESIQNDQTLGGVLGPLGTAAITTDVVEAQNNAGAVQRLLVSLSYTAALPT